jgi:hypothetical protein
MSEKSDRSDVVMLNGRFCGYLLAPLGDRRGGVYCEGCLEGSTAREQLQAFTVRNGATNFGLWAGVIRWRRF